jgi:hypothetical protein
MAIFRKIHVTFWSDAFIQELKDREKLFYIYLLTNDKTTQCGVYELTKKQIAFDLGYSIDTVSILINQFQKYDKIKYNDITNEVSIKNWNKFNLNISSKVQILVSKEVERVKDKTLIQYQYSINTVSILHTQEEEELYQEIEIEIYPFEEFWNDYDKKTGDKDKLIIKWTKLTNEEKLKIKSHIPIYKKSQPEKKFRKDPQTYFNNHSWNDEVIGIIENADVKLGIGEQIINGKRMFFNDEIPMSAPPRPSSQHAWSAYRKIWIVL